MTLSEQPSPASISTQQRGFNPSPLSAHTCFYCFSVFAQEGFWCLLFFFPQSVSNFLCLALGGSSLCSSSEQTSHPKSIQPSPVSLLQENFFRGGLCVKQFIWTCIVGLLLPVRYILDFGADLNRNMAALLHSSPLAGAGVWVICCCCWSRASFWVIIGTKHDISYYHVMWQVVWVTCTNSEWVGTELVCRRHCPCVEEDEGYLITDTRRNESLK